MAFCSQCGAELARDARLCGQCGAAVSGTTAGVTADPVAPPPRPNPVETQSFASQPGARGGRGWLLPVLLVIAVLSIAYLLLAPARTPAPTTRTDTPEAQATIAATEPGSDAAPTRTVSAASLDSSFVSDPQGAAARYAGPVRVSGTIATMVQPGPTPSLSMEGRTRFNYVIVNFPAGYRERLAPLAKGQVITVACGGVRALGGTTILSDCRLD